mgnify:FL=1
MHQGAPLRRRSVLVVPATEPRRILKALGAGADEVVIDLEDAVAADAKAGARAVLAALEWGEIPESPEIAVRVNAPGGPDFHRDLETVVAHVPASSVVVPKVESRSDLVVAERLLAGLEAERHRRDRIAVQALVETAAGLMALGEIVSAPDRLTTVIIGYADLAASLGRGRRAPLASWAPAQQHLLWAGRSAGLEVIDGPYLGVEVDPGFTEEVATAAALGFRSEEHTSELQSH